LNTGAEYLGLQIASACNVALKVLKQACLGAVEPHKLFHFLYSLAIGTYSVLLHGDQSFLVLLVSALDSPLLAGVAEGLPLAIIDANDVALPWITSYQCCIVQ